MAKGLSADELVSSHPELDEKALRRGYAQVKSKAAKPGSAKGQKKVSKKKASKRAESKPVAATPPAAPAAAATPAPSTAAAELRKLILQHGTKAVRSVLSELES